MPPLNTVSANASVQLLPQLDTGGMHAAAARQAIENGLEMECVKKFAHLHSQREAETMLSMLVALFPDQDQDGEGPGESQFTWIRPDEVPAHLSLSSLTFQESLVHEEHLTKVLQDRLAGLDVVVDRSCVHDGEVGGGNVYSRRIFLTAPQSCPDQLPGLRVAHAVLHTNLDRLPRAVSDGVRSEKIPFGRLLMEHVRERCVLLRACWRVAPSPRLQTAFAIPAHVKHKEGTHTTALAPQDGGAQDAGAVPPRSPQACPHVSIGLQHGGVPAAPLPAQYTTYGRTISIVCDGQVAAEVLEIMVPDI